MISKRNVLVNIGIAQIQNCDLEKLSRIRTDSKLYFRDRLKNLCINLLENTFNIVLGYTNS